MDVYINYGIQADLSSHNGELFLDKPQGTLENSACHKRKERRNKKNRESK